LLRIKLLAVAASGDKKDQKSAQYSVMLQRLYQMLSTPYHSNDNDGGELVSYIRSAAAGDFLVVVVSFQRHLSKVKCLQGDIHRC